MEVENSRRETKEDKPPNSPNEKPDGKSNTPSWLIEPEKQASQPLAPTVKVDLSDIKLQLSKASNQQPAGFEHAASASDIQEPSMTEGKVPDAYFSQPPQGSPKNKRNSRVNPRLGPPDSMAVHR